MKIVKLQMMETVRLHQEAHRRVRQFGFLIRLPYHLIFHRNIPLTIDDGYFGWNKEFMICKCGYCFDGFYDSLDCERCYPDYHALKEVNYK